MVVVRENSEGLYAGAGGFHRKGTTHEVAVQESINTRHGVERIVRYAFELAMQPHRRRKLTLVHKTNVLTFAGDLYQRVVDEVAAEFPDVETDYVHVDAACIYFLDWPARFDVIVTDNMFGDIITDLGAMIQGGMGIAAGGNINPDGRVDVRADRRHRARRHRQGHDQPARRDRRDRDAARASSARTSAAEQVDRGIRAATPQMKSMRAGEMGIHDHRGRRPRRRGGDGRERGPAPRVELYDTTLRDGAQRAGPLATRSRTGCGSCTSSTSSACPSSKGGWPGANPRDTEFFQLATKETCKHEHAHRVRHDPARRGSAPRTPPCCATCSTPAPRSCAWWASRGTCTSPRRSARTWTKGVAMVRDSIAFLREPGPPRVLRRRALLRRLPERPGVRDARARGRRGGRRRAARALRHERRHAAVRRRARSSTRCAAQVEHAARHPRAQRRRLRGRELADRGRARRVPGAGRRERLRRAHRATPT